MAISGIGARTADMSGCVEKRAAAKNLAASGNDVHHEISNQAPQHNGGAYQQHSMAFSGSSKATSLAAPAWHGGM